MPAQRSTTEIKVSRMISRGREDADGTVEDAGEGEARVVGDVVESRECS